MMMGSKWAKTNEIDKLMTIVEKVSRQAMRAPPASRRLRRSMDGIGAAPTAADDGPSGRPAERSGPRTVKSSINL